MSRGTFAGTQIKISPAPPAIFEAATDPEALLFAPYQHGLSIPGRRIGGHGLPV